MIKFEDSLGLPVMFDAQSNTLLFDEDEVRVKNVRRYSVKNLRRYLLNVELKYPEDIYITYSDVYSRKSSRSKSRIDITIIPENLLGIEFTKTTPRRVLGTSEKYRIIQALYGTSYMIVQEKTKFPQDIHLVRLDRDAIVVVPSGYHYQFINTRSTASVVAEVYTGRLSQAKSLMPKRGMSYYMICKNAKQEIVQNPAYKHIAKISRTKPEDFNSKFSNHSNLIKKPIYCNLDELIEKNLIA